MSCLSIEFESIQISKSLVIILIVWTRIFKRATTRCTKQSPCLKMAQLWNDTHYLCIYIWSIIPKMIFTIIIRWLFQNNNKIRYPFLVYSIQSFDCLLTIRIPCVVYTLLRKTYSHHSWYGECNNIGTNIRCHQSYTLNVIGREYC